jgi:hypothetical protein
MGLWKKCGLFVVEIMEELWWCSVLLVRPGAGLMLPVNHMRWRLDVIRRRRSITYVTIWRGDDSLTRRHQCRWSADFDVHSRKRTPLINLMSYHNESIVVNALSGELRRSCVVQLPFNGPSSVWPIDAKTAIYLLHARSRALQSQSTWHSHQVRTYVVESCDLCCVG